MRSNKGTEEEEELVKKAGWEVNEFVKRRWKEDRWETAWFVNPPVSRISVREIVKGTYISSTEVAECPRFGAYSRFCKRKENSPQLS